MTTQPVDPWAIIEAVFPKPPEPPRPPVSYTTSNGGGYGPAALAAEADRVATAPEGTRNHALNRAAFSLGQLVAGGVLDTSEVVDTLEQAGRRAGLDSSEITATIISGLRAGQEHPRGVPERDQPASGERDAPTTAGERDHTTWWPRELAGIISGEGDGEPEPTFLQRNDGRSLLYAGKVNALIGESESGKSWLALLTAAQALAASQRVLYLDFEDGPEGIVTRLKLLGVTLEQLERFAYIAPVEAYGDLQRADLTRHLDDSRPNLIVLDGINAAMTLLGYNLIDNMDFTDFSMKILRPLKNTGACLVTVDHVTKSKEGRGAYAIGAQAKRADIDGCSLMVEVDKVFGRGMVGRLKLTVAKDRPGKVRASSAGGKNAGVAVLTSTTDAVRGEIEAPDLRPPQEREPFRPTHLMQKVSEYLELVGEVGATKANVEREVGGNNHYVRDALAALITEGYAESWAGSGGRILNRSLKAFRETGEVPRPPRPDLGQTSATAEVAHAQTTSATRPPVYRGPRAEVSELGQAEDDPGEEWWKK